MKDNDKNKLTIYNWSFQSRQAQAAAMKAQQHLTAKDTRVVSPIDVPSWVFADSWIKAWSPPKLAWNTHSFLKLQRFLPRKIPVKPIEARESLKTFQDNCSSAQAAQSKSHSLSPFLPSPTTEVLFGSRVSWIWGGISVNKVSQKVCCWQ